MVFGGFFVIFALMKINIEFLREQFDYFNALIFQQLYGSLLPTLPIYLTEAKTFLAKCCCRRTRTLNGWRNTDFSMRFNIRIDLEPAEIEDTLIHEMIHYYIMLNHVKDTGPHGDVFKRMMTEINSKYGRRISVRHNPSSEQREQGYDNRRRWHVISLIEFKDGRYGIKVLPRVIEHILNYHSAFSTDSRVAGIEFFLHNDPYFNRFPNSSALRSQFCDGEEVRSHLKGAHRLVCENGKVIQK